MTDWPEVLAGDEVMATAILDHLLHRSHVVNVTGRSYGLKDLENAYSEAALLPPRGEEHPGNNLPTRRCPLTGGGRKN